MPALASRPEPHAAGAAPLPEARPVLFFDAGCGLCQRSVQLLLRADRRERLRFAPIGGTTWGALVPEDTQRTAPDSALLRLPDGRLLSRSAAILGALREAGGPWRTLAILGRLVPRALSDRLYDAVARRRRGIAACPLSAGRPLRFLP